MTKSPIEHHDGGGLSAFRLFGFSAFRFFGFGCVSLWFFPPFGCVCVCVCVAPLFLRGFPTRSMPMPANRPPFLVPRRGSHGH